MNMEDYAHHIHNVKLAKEKEKHAAMRLKTASDEWKARNEELNVANRLLEEFWRNTVKEATKL